MFQIVRLMLDENGDVVSRRPLQPLFELREHAMLFASNEASGLWGDYGYDEERRRWWASDSRGRRYHFVIESIATVDMAA
jgi:hypothetical protein